MPDGIDAIVSGEQTTFVDGEYVHKAHKTVDEGLRGSKTMADYEGGRSTDAKLMFWS